MKIDVKVIPRARKDLIKEEKGLLKVYLCAPASEGKANKALIKILAQHFKIPQSRVEIIKGLKSRHKTINISENTTCGTKCRKLFV